MKYIDIHGHINFPDYDQDREEVFARAKLADVGMIIIGTDLESSRRAVDLAEKHDNVWATVGVHPTDSVISAAVDAGASVGDSVPVFDHLVFKELAKHHKVVAIGECGLDYFHYRPDAGQVGEIYRQRDLFINHIQLANEVNKPLMLHVRNGPLSNVPNSATTAESSTANSSAYLEVVKILQEHAKVQANFHFFAGSKQDAEAILAIDGMLSFTGVITFARNYDEVIKFVPLDRLMSETDCPYVAPIPYRGKRNEPCYVIEVVKMIAKIRGESEGLIADQFLENSRRFYKLTSAI